MKINAVVSLILALFAVTAWFTIDIHLNRIELYASDIKDMLAMQYGSPDDGGEGRS
jgi:hypothetical protein